ncbi:MAG: pseudouridine synthase [Planctomycetota bacterium]
MTERLQKLLAQAGLGSRRACEDLIREGRVTVNKKPAKLGDKADPGADDIRCDGERLHLERRHYIALHKPKGYVSTNADELGRPRVVDLLPDLGARLFPAGRLDEDSEGLIILTNDGEFANRITHPRFGVKKTYVAEVRGALTPEILGKLKKGVWLSEGKAQPAGLRVVEKWREQAILEVVIWEGMNRQVRRMIEGVGLRVRRLTRTAIGPLKLGSLPMGKHRRLTDSEIRAVQGVSVSDQS